MLTHEALACSMLPEQAVSACAAIHVLYATDKDYPPWPQRLLERKWRLGAADRRGWGKLRRGEALAALHILGVGPANTGFFALPDQQLTHLLVTDCRFSFARFATFINDWAPTHLLVNSIHDTHPDHSALAVMLRLALGKLYPDGSPMSVWAYTVHGKESGFFRSRTHIAAIKDRDQG